MKSWAVPVGAGIVAAAVTSVGIGVPSVWYDEAATVSAATRPIPQLFGLLGNIDAVHGVYYLLMHAVFGAVGYSPLSLRIVSALAVGVATALVVVLDRQLRPGSRGIVAGLVFCLLPRVTWMAGEGRSYALATALAALCTVLLLHALAGGGRRRWILYGAVTFLACVVFVYVVLLVAAHGLAVLVFRRRMLVPWVLAAGAAAVALIPFVLLVASERGQLPDTPPLGLGTVEDALVTQWFGSNLPVAVLAWALLIVGLAARPTRILLPLVLLPTALLLGGALVNPELYEPRYLSVCTPFVAVGAAAGIAAIPWRAARAVAAVALLVLAVPSLVAERAVDAKKDKYWSTIAGIVAGARDSADTAIVYGALSPHHSATARVISVAYPAAFAGMTDVTLGVPAADSTRLWGTWSRLDESLGRLDGIDEAFVVGTDDSDAEILERAGWLPEHEWHEGNVTVVQLHR